MEHGASELVKEQSHTVMTTKAEVVKAAQSTAYRGVQTNANFTDEESGLVELVKSEPALLVKAEVVEDGWQDIAELQCMQGPSTSAIVGSANVLDSIGDLHNILNVKEELGAIDIGPTVLQHTDAWYTTNQKDVSVVKEERTINHDKTDPILCVGVKEEIIEDEQRGSPTPRNSLMEQPGICTALRSLRKECLETVCRVELIRLDTVQCEVCDAVYVDAHELLHHVQEVHGPRPRGSLRQHVKSPQISKGQQCATVSSPVVHTCDYCHKTYINKQGLIHHIDVVHTKVLYRCSECNVEFKGKHLLRGHMKRVHLKEKHKISSPVVHTCEYCHKTYMTKKGLICHIDVVHTKVLYRCSECNAEFKGKHLLQGHMTRVHLKEKHETDTDDQRRNKVSQSKQRAQSQLYSCDTCGKTYTTKMSVLRHYRNRHTTESHKCTKCNKKFPSKVYLYNHTRDTHSEQQYECAVCKKILRSKAALRMHVSHIHRSDPAADTDVQRSNEGAQSELRAQSQLYSCDKCVKTYSSKYSLLAHNESLHSTESHQCIKCNKNFPSKAYLYRHTITAHSEQQYECALCKKICGSKRALYKHVYYVHRPRPAGSEPRIHICDYCQKTFTIKANLAVHITHVHRSGSHECSQCNKHFKCEDYLKTHITQTHTAVSERRIHICNYCKKTFRSKSKLTAHITCVHGSGSYKCSQCNKCFKCKEYLMMHTKRTHSESHQLHTCTNCGKNFNSKVSCRQHEKRGKCTRPTASNTSTAASTSRQQHNVVIVKEEPADGELDLGPVVFQHVDCNYRPYKQEPGLD